MTKITVNIILLFSVYLFCGLICSYYNTLIYELPDIFYDTDINYHYNLLYMEKGSISLDRHPFTFIVAFVLKTISFFIPSPKLVLLFCQAVVATFNNIILFVILRRIKIRLSSSVFFTMIYAFSFSTLFFVSFPEVYLYSSCIGLLLTYFILPDSVLFGKSLSEQTRTLVVAFLCVCGFGINTVNIVLYIPLLIYYFSEISQTQRKFCIFTFFFSFMLLFSVFVIIGEFVCHLSGMLFSDMSLSWVKLDFSLTRAVKVFQETFIAPFYALDTDLILKKGAYGWYFTDIQNPLYFIPFLLLMVFADFRKHREKTPYIIYACAGVVILHAFMNYFYNITWFLYSQNYLFLFIVFMAYLYSETNAKKQAFILSAFLIFQILLNFKMLYVFAVWLNGSVIPLIPDAVAKVAFADLVIIGISVLCHIIAHKSGERLNENV